MFSAHKIDAPIFVVGTPRSGTTLTARILGRHSRIFMPGETHFFDDIYSRRRELGEPPEYAARERIFARLSTLYGRYNEPPDQQRVEALFRDGDLAAALKARWSSYEEVFSSFMELQTVRAGKEVWGNNAPRDLFNAREILAFFPNARFVVCVRDVRDFLLSYAGKARVSPLVHRQRLEKLYHPILTSLLWKSSIRQLARLRHLVPESQLTVLRYEDLVTDPENEIAKLCTGLGVDFEPQMLEVDTHNSSFEAPGEGIFSSSIGRWQDRLPAAEAAWAQRINHRELVALGYDVAPLRPDFGRMLVLLGNFPLALVRAFHANRKHRGSLLPYLLKRAGFHL